jgi:hypothetical protein
MIPQEFNLNEDEKALLSMGVEAEEFIRQPYWKRVEIFLNALVSEALDDMRGNASSDGDVALHKQRIWREREHLRDSLIAFVKSPIRDRKELMEQVEKLRKEGALIYARTDNTTND